MNPPTHIRRPGPGLINPDDPYWEALCGEVRPGSSFSLKHAVDLYAGRIRKDPSIAICAACDAVLRREAREAPPV